ncbi:hypothetical protein V8C35DRAFT_298070 [Trichoderma chlorosporum]
MLLCLLFGAVKESSAHSTSWMFAWVGPVGHEGQRARHRQKCRHPNIACPKMHAMYKLIGAITRGLKYPHTKKQPSGDLSVPKRTGTGYRPLLVNQREMRRIILGRYLL